MFDFLTWGFHELHVPHNSEPRSFRSIFHFLRSFSVDPSVLRMIIGLRAGTPSFIKATATGV